MTTYTFTNSWAADRMQDWSEILAPFVGLPNVQFAEIGSYEGQSACWFVDNILTGHGATMTCFDPWKAYADHPDADWGAIEARFDANAEACSRPWAVIKVRGTSRDLARRSPHEGYDMVYIDGDHSASQVLRDAVLAWDVLKVGGLLMFDDYGWRPDTDRTEDCPANAIDAFKIIMAIGGNATIASQTNQMIVLRRMK